MFLFESEEYSSSSWAKDSIRLIKQRMSDLLHETSYQDQVIIPSTHVCRHSILPVAFRAARSAYHLHPSHIFRYFLPQVPTFSTLFAAVHTAVRNAAAVLPLFDETRTQRGVSLQ